MLIQEVDYPKSLVSYVKFCEIISKGFHRKRNKNIGSMGFKETQENINILLQAIETVKENKTIENIKILTDQVYYASLYDVYFSKYIKEVLAREFPQRENTTEGQWVIRMLGARRQMLALSNQYQLKSQNKEDISTKKYQK